MLEGREDGVYGISVGVVCPSSSLPLCLLV